MMAKHELYQQIAEHFRLRIFRGELNPGEKLPPMRAMADRWNCTAGTVQRAYQQLASEGLVSSMHGQGTRVASVLPEGRSSTLRTVSLVHKAESFLIESFMTGYNQSEIENAVQLALDHWRLAEDAVKKSAEIAHKITFSGSHDLALVLISANFDELHPEYSLNLAFSGSLGGLIALSEGKAELAGCHLWDAKTDTYNDPFIKRLFNTGVSAITLAQRRVGWITAPGNPKHFSGLSDLTRNDIVFVNRQEGSGTRVWLDAKLQESSIDGNAIEGYENEVWTHSESAQLIAENKADVTFGLEAAAQAFDLHFTYAALEQYDLVYRDDPEPRQGLQVLLNYLQSPSAKKIIQKMAGYDTSQTGNIRKVN